MGTASRHRPAAAPHHLLDTAHLHAVPPSPVSPAALDAEPHWPSWCRPRSVLSSACYSCSSSAMSLFSSSAAASAGSDADAPLISQPTEGSGRSRPRGRQQLQLPWLGGHPVLLLLLMSLLLMAAVDIGLRAQQGLASCSQRPVHTEAGEAAEQALAEQAAAAAPAPLGAGQASAARPAPSSLPECLPPVFTNSSSALPPSPSPEHCAVHRFTPWRDSTRSYPAHVWPVHTFLISVPRSGNSMTRKILEDGTGIVTGTVYNDQGLKEAGFQGEMQRENVLLIKHHFVSFGRPSTLNTAPIYSSDNTGGAYAVERFVYIVRNPVDSSVSWSMFRTSNHSHTKELKLQNLRRVLFDWLQLWVEHVTYFTHTFLSTTCADCDWLVLRYEDFVLKQGEPGARMLCFLGYSPERGCRPAGDAKGGQQQAGVSYALKTRRSILNSSLVVPHNVSYAQELFSLLTQQERDSIDRMAGLQMRAYGYWPQGY